MYLIRAEKVILDRDLAQLYQVENRALKQAVRRNRDRFPPDFMFELSQSEIEEMVSQNVMPSKSYFGGSLPMAFTEQGVAMLSGILTSGRAIEVNIAIMRAFVQLRRWMHSNDELSAKIDQLEARYDENFRVVFEALRLLTKKPDQSRRMIGFKPDVS